VKVSFAVLLLARARGENDATLVELVRQCIRKGLAFHSEGALIRITSEARSVSGSARQWRKNVEGVLARTAITGLPLREDKLRVAQFIARIFGRDVEDVLPAEPAAPANP